MCWFAAKKLFVRFVARKLHQEASCIYVHQAKISLWRGDMCIFMVGGSLFIWSCHMRHNSCCGSCFTRPSHIWSSAGSFPWRATTSRPCARCACLPRWWKIRKSSRCCGAWRWSWKRWWPKTDNVRLWWLDLSENSLDVITKFDGNKSWCSWG